MKVGMLGDIAFEVSDETVQTLNNLSWSGSARYASHQRHGTDVKTEFTGLDADKLQFDIVLSAYLGVNPMEQIGKLWAYEREGRTLPLVLGNKVYGKWRWSLLKHNVKAKFFDGDGDLTHCTVTVNLQEYIYW